MTLDQLDDAIILRNYRLNVIRLAEVATASFMELKFHGFPHPDSHISLQVVRDAVVAECNRLKAEYEAKLQAMGVTIE